MVPSSFARALLPLVFAGGCAAAPPPPARTSPLLPEDPAHPAAELSASFEAIQSACDQEEQRLRTMAQASCEKRQNIEAVLAGTAGGLALATTVYAGLSDGPSGFVVVPLAGGSAAAAAPLTVLLLQPHEDLAIEERLLRIEDHRALVRDAHRNLLMAARHREQAATRADEAVGDAPPLDAVSEALQRAGQQLEAADKDLADLPVAPQKSDKDPKKGDKTPAEAPNVRDTVGDAQKAVGDARAENQRASALVEALQHGAGERAEHGANMAKQRELEAAHALDEALLRLGEVCRPR